MKVKFIIGLLIIVTFVFSSSRTHADVSQIDHRMNLYHEYSIYTNIPWHIIGAIDQYERNTKYFKPHCPKEDEVISICVDPKLWKGIHNPIDNDMNPATIHLFHGFGVDGDDDGLADRLNPKDRITAMLNYITEFGTSKEDIEESLLNYYQSEKGVQVIFQISQLFEHYETIDLNKRVFPIPKYYAADYTNNFGTGRSYGGYRIHEGVDIFSHYGTPVVSTAYGIVEIIGWNNYGGYRIGIRDIYNTYQYYAHLNRYADGIKEGDIVAPGQVIGYVGSTGYGKEGTSGKFPPHLHFGFYKFDGRREWSFNPYPYLRRWDKIVYKR